MDEKLKKKLLDALKEKGYSDDEAEAFYQKVVSEDEEPIEDEIEEAKEDIEENGEDTQSEKDREDESVGEQIEDKGEEDSQTTEDRIDESEGEEKAEEKAEEEKEAEEVEEEEEKPSDEKADRIDALEAKIDGVIAMLEKITAGRADDEDEEAFRRAEKRYGANAGVFAEEHEPKEEMTAKEAADIFRKLKR